MSRAEFWAKIFGTPGALRRIPCVLAPPALSGTGVEELLAAQRYNLEGALLSPGGEVRHG